MTRETGSWMPIYWSDYFGDTMHLTTEQHGAYLLLLGAYWLRGGPLPADDAYLKQVTRAGKRWGHIKPVVLTFFDLEELSDVDFGSSDNRLTVPTEKTHNRFQIRHKRLEKEILRSSERLKSARASGRAGGLAKSYQATATAIREEETNADALAKKGANHGRRPGARCPADLEITEQDREYAQSRGVNGDELWPGYIAHFTSGQGRNKTSSNWHGGNSCWGTWCRNEAKWAAERRRDGPKSTGIVAGALEDIAALEGKV